LNAPGDREELKRILWSHARSKDKAHSIKASVELERIERDERAAKASEPVEPAAVLAQIAEIMPAMAVALAAKNNVEFKLNDSQRAAYDDFRRTIALEYINERHAKTAVSPDSNANDSTEAQHG
jgi:hypothetical protein